MNLLFVYMIHRTRQVVYIVKRSRVGIDHKVHCNTCMRTLVFQILHQCNIGCQTQKVFLCSGHLDTLQDILREERLITKCQYINLSKPKERWYYGTINVKRIIGIWSYLCIPPLSCRTSLQIPVFFMYAEALSHLMPPVQYMSTLLSLKAFVFLSK